MGRWRFEITEKAEADLANLDTAVRKRITEKLQWIIHNFEHITPIPLEEPLKGFFKLRVGDWRIIYEVENIKTLVIIHLIDRRDKIYKKLKQRIAPRGRNG